MEPTKDALGWIYRAKPAFGNKPKVVASLRQGILNAVKSKKKDLYRIYDAWTFDEAIVRHAKQNGCKRVVVFDRDHAITYETAIDSFDFAVPDRRLPQVHLPLKHWRSTDDPQPDLGFVDDQPDQGGFDFE